MFLFQYVPMVIGPEVVMLVFISVCTHGDWTRAGDACFYVVNNAAEKLNWSQATSKCKDMSPLSSLAGQISSQVCLIHFESL